MIDRHGFHLENVEGQDVTTVLEAFALEYYGNAPSIPPQIVVPPDATGLEALQGFLSELRGSRVEVRAPARGEKRRLAELAAQNATARARLGDCSSRSRSSCAASQALEELREALNLESLPLRIECFDISNIQGQEIVGSMVVFQDGMPKKAHYRKFGGARPRRPGRLRGDGRGRLAPVRAAAHGTEDEYDEGFATAPNLVVIDGGKGQLSAALAAMQAYELPRVAVISLAKRDRGGLRPAAVRSDPARPAQRRLATAPACSGRGAPLRARLPPPAAFGAVARVALRHARGRRAGAAAGAPPTFRLDGGRGRRDARRSSRACPASRRRRRARSTRSSTRPAPASMLRP